MRATADTPGRARRLRKAACLPLLTVAALLVLEGSALAAPPANDDFADAQVLAGPLPISVNGSNIFATSEPGEPEHDNNGPPYNSVWYSWTAPSAGPVRLSTAGSDLNTVLAVYTGNAVGALTEVASNSSGVDFIAVAGTTYRIAVDGFQNQAGGFSLHVQAPGAILGQVSSGVDDTLAGICVTAYDAGSNAVGNVHTDQSGEYAIFGLATGSYRLEFSDCHIHNYLTEFYDDEPDLASADPVAVTAGSATANVDVRLTLGDRITGTVTDSQGDPVGGICVDAFDAEGNLVRDDLTDGSGNYRIIGLEVGDYRLRFSDCFDGLYEPEFYDDKPDLGSADPIAVTSGSTTSGIDIQIAERGRIAGTVTSSEGTPLPGVCVDAFDAELNVAGLGFTDAVGGYAIPGLVAGGYKLRFRDCNLGGGDFAAEYYDNADQTTAALVLVTPDTTTNIDVGLARDGDITPPDTAIAAGPSGTVATTAALFTYSAEPGAERFECALDDAAFNACPDGGKSYSGLPDGEHTFAVRAIDAAGNADASPASRTWTIDSSAGGGEPPGGGGDDPPGGDPPPSDDDPPSGDEDPPPGDPGTIPCPEGTSESVVCKTDAKGRLNLQGTKADETLVGTGEDEIFTAGAGDDKVNAKGGRDKLSGQGGRDKLKGQGGKDRLRGHGGKDAFSGGGGNDRIDSKGQKREKVNCGSGKRDRVKGAKRDRVKRNCERVKR